jgi:hypothetical protein
MPVEENKTVFSHSLYKGPGEDARATAAAAISGRFLVLTRMAGLSEQGAFSLPLSHRLRPEHRPHCLIKYLQKNVSPFMI